MTNVSQCRHVNFVQVELRPDWYGASLRFDTMPSSSIAQACLNTLRPSSSRSSFNFRGLFFAGKSSRSACLRTYSGTPRMSKGVRYVECIEDEIVHGAVATFGRNMGFKRCEVGVAILIDHDHFAIDYFGLDVNVSRGRNQRREAVGPVISAARVAVHLAVASATRE
jgi:hypothetical protein